MVALGEHLLIIMQMTGENAKNTFDKSREHLANERTFLAWIRTSIALMGFGFVIVKFTLFLKELSFLLDSKDVASQGYSSSVGVIMVAVGVIIALLAYLQYKKYENQLNAGSFVPSSLLSLFITLIILIGGIILIGYLLSSI
jgi:putative membrane protein